MSCDDVWTLKELFGSAGAHVDPEIRAHVRRCAACAARVSSSGAVASVDHRLTDRILTRLHADLKPVVPLPGTWALALRFATAFIFLVLAVVSGGHSMDLEDLGKWLQGIPVLVLAVGVLAVGVLTIVLALSSEMVPGARLFLGYKGSLIAAIASLVVSICLLNPWRIEQHFIATGWHCTEQGLACAVPAAMIAMMILRAEVIISAGQWERSLAPFPGWPASRFSASNVRLGVRRIWRYGTRACP